MKNSFTDHHPNHSFYSSFVIKIGILLILFTLLDNSKAYGQTFIGISGGADLYEQVDFRAALIVESKKTDWFYWQAELVYVKRENIDILQKLPTDKTYVRPVISYLSIPLLAKLNIDISGAGLFILAGPQFSKATALTASTWLENGQLLFKNFPIKETQLSFWDVGIHAGIGLQKVISKEKKIFVEFRYYLGLKNISQGENDSIYNEGKSFNIGFLLPLK